MKRIVAVVLTLIMLLAMALPAAAQGDQTIVEIASGDDRFETLVSALESAGLVETLSGEGPFTVFAPTDDAFAALPEGTLESLDTETLTAILTYHVVSGEVLAADVVGLDGQSVATVQGEEVAISVNGDAVAVNEANVIITDIQASNGVIHVIDSVLLPPSVVEMMSADDMSDESMDEDMDDEGEDGDAGEPETMPTTGGENDASRNALIALAAGLALLGGAFSLRTQQR